VSGTITHIFVAPARKAPTKSLQAVEAMKDQGLEGDRYFEARNRSGPDSQVTLIEGEHIEAFTRDTGLAMTPAMPRRNLVTREVALNDLVGKRFAVGEAVFEGIELCEPCSVFARNTHREVMKYFAGKGGLRARIVRGGVIRVGSPVKAQR